MNVTLSLSFVYSLISTLILIVLVELLTLNNCTLVLSPADNRPILDTPDNQAIPIQCSFKSSVTYTFFFSRLLW